MKIFDKIQEQNEDDILLEETPERKIGWFKTLWRRDRIYVRLLSAIMFFSVIPCILIGLWANYYIKNVVLNHYMEEYLDSVYENVQNGMNHYIDQISAYSVYVFSDGMIYSICDDDTKSGVEKEEKIKSYLNDYWNDCELVANMDIVMKSGLTIRKKPEEIKGVSQEFSDNLRHTNILISNGLAENESGEKYLVFGRKVFNLAKNKDMFDLYIYVPEEKIYGALSELNNNGNMFFLVAEDKVISHQNKSNLGSYMLFPKDLTNSEGLERQKIGDYIYDYTPLNLKIAMEGEWAIESQMSYSWLSKTVERLQYETMIIVFAAVIISLCLAILIPTSLLRSISLLKRRMDVFVKKGCKEYRNPDFSYKEISDLESSFNKMVKEINDLIERNNIEKEKQRRAELVALQAQINPHFIYNALDAIAWYAKIEKQTYLADMVYELATFFRISLHKGDNIIKVSEEISHVESYIAIEQMRFPNVFDVEYKIQEDLLDAKMIKIVLQPIVENSIKHGFENMDSGGKINITGFVDENGDIIFEIEDNGQGMDFDPLCETSKKGGYGIHNVNERIQLEYGKEYGLSYHSILGEGTLVKVRLKSLN